MNVIFIRNTLLACMIGNLLYFLFPFSPVLWRLSFVGLSLYCGYKNATKFGFDTVEKSIVAFVFLNLIYFFASYLWLTPSTTQIGNTLYALLAFISFAYLGKSGVLTSKFITLSGILLIVAAILSFYHAQQLALIKLLTEADDTTVNASVLFLMFLPMVLIIRNRVISLMLFCVCLFFLVQGAKRGNIIAAVLPSALYVWMLFNENRKSFSRILLLIVAMVGVAIWTKDIILSDDYLLQRYEDTLEGNSSGRDVIYQTMWNMWYEANSVLTIIFGYGFAGTVTFSSMHKMAHNDWLEILVDYGLVGIVCYLWIFVSFFKVVIKMKSSIYRCVLLSILFVWFSKTLFSMGFVDEALALMAIPFGCIIKYEYIKDENY